MTREKREAPSQPPKICCNDRGASEKLGKKSSCLSVRKVLVQRTRVPNVDFLETGATFPSLRDATHESYCKQKVLLEALSPEGEADQAMHIQSIRIY